MRVFSIDSKLHLIFILVLVIGGGISSLFFYGQDKSRDRSTNAYLTVIGQKLDLFYSDCGVYPITKQGLGALIEHPGDDVCKNWGPESYVKCRSGWFFRLRKNAMQFFKEAPMEGRNFCFVDSWNKPIIYTSDGRSFKLLSLGRDGREGGVGSDKDVVFPSTSP